MSARQHHFQLFCLVSVFALAGLSATGQQVTPTDYNHLMRPAHTGPPALIYNHATSLTAEIPNDTPPPLRPGPALIIKSFADAEMNFRKLLVHFSFKRDVLLQTIGVNGEITGEYIRNSTFVLDDRGRRLERVLYHPQPTIKELIITKEDIQDLAGSQLFGLESTEAEAYNFSYLGEEKLKGKAAYVLAVSPKQEIDPDHMRSRFFVGKVWIDQATFQAIQLRGVTEPQGKQRFPIFETMRDIKVENLSFPSSTSADDVLCFPHKTVRYRLKVRYYDFKRFSSRVKIVELD